MIETMANWWRGHAPGERRLMMALGIAVALVVLWLGIWRPVTLGLEAGWARQSAALDRNALVRGEVETLRHLPASTQSTARPAIDQYVGQTAAEAGFTLDQSSPQGAGRITINIAAARMGPLLSWLARLEASGIGVRTISIVPGASEGTVAVQALLEESAP